ncbi:MAG TPA: DUF1549 domain-containing protein, partial [Planctomycetota bacterium]|nr:DUF1549 domain-containing protein [Planctomycetota bacterium]
MRAVLIALLLVSPQDAAPAPVDFVRDVQPILRDACLKCHGEKKPKGQLRLDSRLLAMKGGVSGKAILPGKGAESLLIKILLDPDEEVRMPQKADALPAATVALLRRWIDEGAVWPDSAAGDATVEVHWAYVKPVRREPPAAAANAIDGFVRHRLRKEGLEPSPEADRPTLIKRLSYDLLGLPPSPEEVDAFVSDAAPEAYERLVDRLLASPHYGERWGRHWLDKARYADSDGYEKDSHRPDAWRYRDWVIDALNDDMPFDRFTTEQLAGDLLPDAGPLQALATAFHRQTLTNNEGGVDKEQFRVEAVFDRTETTATVWLGLTVGCARCHNHKYDAISQQEYYQLYAFFNNADETTAEVPVSEEAMAKYLADKAEHDRGLRDLERQLAKERPALVELLPSWESGVQAKLRIEKEQGIRFEPLEILSIKPVHEVTFAKQKDGSYLAGGADAATETYTITAKAPARPVTGLRLEVLPDKSLPRQGPGRSGGGNFVLSEIRLAGAAWKGATADFSQKGWDVKAAVDGDPKTGWGIAPQMGKPHAATFTATAPIETDGPLVITLDQQYGDRHTIGRFRLLAMTGTTPPLDLPDAARKALATAAEKRSDQDREALLELVALEAPGTKALARKIQEHRAREPKPPVMQARVLAQRTANPRVTKLFHRGEFLQPKHEVAPGTLATLHPFQARGTEPDRLDLVRWLFHPDNPLTARVAV